MYDSPTVLAEGGGRDMTMMTIGGGPSTKNKLYDSIYVQPLTCQGFFPPTIEALYCTTVVTLAAPSAFILLFYPQAI